MTQAFLRIAVFACCTLSAVSHGGELAGDVKQWHTVTLTFHGPRSSERATPNPFADYRLTVWFIHPNTTQRYEVPGFFAADGNAAETSATEGNKWRVRFSPPLVGKWTYRAELKRGAGIVPLEGASGEFTVAASQAIGDDFRRHGHLRYVGERYLRFAGTGKYFLKAGADSPETLLGYHDFDGTWHDTQEHPIPAPHDPIVLPSLDKGLHHYPDHVRDWREGEPTWQDGKGKGLIGGLNYLADQGVNSVYFLTMNVNGDGRNVWPWTDPWKHDRFDVSKLAQWEIVFEHMQRRGIQMHVVLQETENDHILDAGELGPARKLYLREMIARFAHHPAVVWNLGEENLQTPAQQQAMSDYIRSVDPYDHPIVIHNDHYSPENIQDTFDPLLGNSTLDGTAIQDFQWNDVHAHTKQYVAASRRAGKPWFVCVDEMGGAQFGLPTDEQEPNHFNARSKGLWGNLMAGGAGVEWYFGWQNNSPQSDLSAETWRPREAMWKQSKIAIDFFQKYLPFHEMQAADHLALAYADYNFAQPGDTYCIYLFSGGNTRLNLEQHAGPFSVHWFDPRNGGQLQIGSVRTVWGPGLVEIGEPPTDQGHDWVCLVRRTEPIFRSGKRDGNIVVEAEHFESQSNDDLRRWYVHKKSGQLPNVDGAGDPKMWVRGILSASKPASKGRFLRILPDTRKTHNDKLLHGENFSPQPGKMAIVRYRVNFDQPGRYYVWVRAFSTGTEDNAIHVGLNGDWPSHGQRMQWSEPKRQWVWGCARRTDDVPGGVPMEIYLDVPTAGTHTVEFSMREDGFAMDQFLLTRDQEYRPSGVEQESGISFQLVEPTQTVDQAKTAKLDRKLGAYATAEPKMVFPGKEWAKGTPESQGIDSAKLQAALHYLAGHCKEDKLGEVMIVRNGVCVYEGNNTTEVHNIWSCSKSFTSTVLGLLIADGKCSLDTKAADIEPLLAEHYPDVILRDFTTMTSGYSAKGRSRWRDENEDWSWTPYVPEAPLYEAGKAYAYWDESMMMLGRLLTKVGQREINDFLNERLFEPMQMGKVEWLHEGEVDGIKICNGCTNIKLNARQMARYGHLFLNRGNWNGQQLVPASWVAEATRNQVDVAIPVAETDRSNVRGPGAYGYNWWTNGGENRMPDAPPKTYYASGLNHNLLFVIPEWNMVVVRMGVDGNPPMGKPQAWNGFFRKLAVALNEPTGLREMNTIAKPPAEQVIAIVNARLVDGRGGTPIDEACVLVVGDTITFAGPMAKAKIPTGAQRVDAAGKCVLPGLFDSHFHSRNSAQTLIEYELNNGITSFRDPGHPFKFYDWLLDSQAVIPRVFLCGGHLDAKPAAWPDQATVVATNHDAVDAVNRHVQRGASAIKIYMRVPLEQIRAACEAASQRGVPVTAHLELIDADDAIRAGVAGIEHITSFGTTLAAPEHTRQFKQAVREDSAARRTWRPRLWQRLDLDNNPRLDPLIDLIVQRQTFISPTLAIFEARPDVKDGTPEKVEAFEKMMRFLALCHQRGARIVVGSHTAAPFAAKGKAYLREVELMAEAGMSPLEIITAATKNNALFFGVHDRLGTIEAGKQADLILVDGDPTRDISDIDNIARVMLGGVWVKMNAVAEQKDSSAQSLTVKKVSGPPSGPLVRIQQTQRDETGPTSFRYYAPRVGEPTKTNALAYDPDPTRSDEAIKSVAEARYYYRDRDLGQTFTTGKEGFKLGAVTVRLQPVDVAKADPAGARVSLQLMRVTGMPKINGNGTTGDGQPPYTNPRWATYAFTWPDDPHDDNTPDRRPFKHFSDDFMEGESYEHLMLASGGIIPHGLKTNDYLRWELGSNAQYYLEPNTTYAILFLFDEPAPAGVKRNIPLSNRNVLPGGKSSDPFPGGHMIRRDGSSTVFEDVFIANVNDPTDVQLSRKAATFPPQMKDRLAIQPGTLGYPDVDTYRDLYFVIEAAK